MRRILLIGIGAGHPDYVTMQAVKALNEADVFFMVDKGEDTSDLEGFRKDICARYINEPSYRVVTIREVSRDRTPTAYETEVVAWRDKRKAAYYAAIGELQDDECGAFLVWGEPALYDGTMDILDQVLNDAPGTFVYQVIPGISSLQALAAQHKVALNRIGRPFQVTTGRRLAEGFPEEVDDLVVMLDARNAFRTVADQDVDIYWGAYLGTEDEVLISGKVRDVMDEIERVRTQKKAEKGWIMDTYLLRRKPERA